MNVFDDAKYVSIYDGFSFDEKTFEFYTPSNRQKSLNIRTFEYS